MEQMFNKIWRMFCHFGPFFPFYSTNYPQNQNFEKMKKKKKHLEILLVNTTVPQMTTISCMAPEI